MAQTLAVADCSTSLSMADSCETSDASVLKERTSSRALSDVVSIEYPLKRRWTFWYLNDKRDLFWEKRLKIVTTISSVDEFWGMHMSIRPPSLLPSSCDYNLFKENIQPMWEVPENSNGGRWIVAVDRSRPPEVLDAVWLEVMLMIIGEQFGVYMEGICGIICNIRNKGSKVSIWTRDARNVDTIMQIGEILKEKLKSQSGGMRWAESITFEEHQANRQNSARKNVITLKCS